MDDFERIRATHTSTVWSVVARILKNRDDAQECFQEVFAEAILRAERKRVDDWGALLRWLATRRAIDHLRRRRRSRSFSDLDTIRDNSHSAEDEVRFKELVELVREELGQLPEKQAQAFWLVCVENCSSDEVAAQMGETPNAVRVLVHRARLHLRNRLKSYVTFEPEPNPK